MFAGAAVAVASWVLLQLLGMGAGLAAIEIGDDGSLRSIGIGTGVWSLIAPILAMFAGAFVAGRLATTFDQKVSAMHGIIVWAISSLAGVLAIAWMISAIAGSAMNMAYAEMSSFENVRIDPDLRATELEEATENVGKILLLASLSLLLALGSAVAGGVLAVRRYVRPRHDTQEVPVVPPPAEPPADAPHVRTP